MENTFVKLLRANCAEVADTLKNADELAAADPSSRYLVYLFDDGSARTLRIPAESEEPDLTDEPCVLVGSFCYQGSAPAKPPAGRNYEAIVENCIVILHHYR